MMSGLVLGALGLVDDQSREDGRVRAQPLHRLGRETRRGALLEEPKPGMSVTRRIVKRSRIKVRAGGGRKASRVLNGRTAYDGGERSARSGFSRRLQAVQSGGYCYSRSCADDGERIENASRVPGSKRARRAFGKNQQGS